LDSPFAEELWRRWSGVRLGWNTSARSVLVAVALLLVVVATEAVYLVAGLRVGAAAALGALALFLAVAGLRSGRPEGEAALALAVIPLLRMLSIALPSVLVPEFVWYAEIGLPVVAAVLLVARVVGLRPADIGIRRAPVGDALVLAAGGLVLGLLAVEITGQVSILPDRSIATAVLASIAVVLGAAVAEELLLRGLLLQVAEGLVVGSGVLVTTAISTLLYLGTLNVRYIIFMAAVALVLAVMTRRSGSLMPAFACHATLAWSQLILWPVILS
jgi:membrane protease YdiL (CAAX protease family)